MNGAILKEDTKRGGKKIEDIANPWCRVTRRELLAIEKREFRHDVKIKGKMNCKQERAKEDLCGFFHFVQSLHSDVQNVPNSLFLSSSYGKFRYVAV